MGGIQSPISFCLYVVARAMCGIECKSRRLVLQLQSAEVSQTVTSSLVGSWTISVNEGIQDTEN
jgi:hypothetical protein